MGSSVFIIKVQNFKKNTSNKNSRSESEKEIQACDHCRDSKFKKDRCILIRNAYLNNANISAVSRKLGVSRTTIYKHINNS
jgi:transcriptional regulator with PAS, ATPase and Fis domain